MDSLYLDIWHSKLNKSDFKMLADIIKEAKEQREKEELQHIPEEDTEVKVEKKNNKKKVDEHLEDKKENKTNQQPIDEAKDEPENDEESEEYISEDEDMETFQNESLEVMQIAKERKILDETAIMQRYNLSSIDGDKLQEWKLKFINDYLEEQNVIPLMNELMTKLI